MSKSALASALLAMRKGVRLSQPKLAALSGVSRNTISAIERGKTLPDPQTLLLLAQGLATDEAGRTDRLAGADFQERLFVAAGYLPQFPPPEPPQPAEARPSARHQLYDFFLRHPDLADSMGLLVDQDQTGDLYQEDVDGIITFVEGVRARRGRPRG